MIKWWLTCFWGLYYCYYSFFYILLFYRTTLVYRPFLFIIPSRVPKAHFLASIRTKREIISRTPDSAARCPKHDEQPTFEEQALENQLTKEQFDNELEKDLEVILTQEQCDEEEGWAVGRAGEAAEGEEVDDDDDEDSEEGYVSPEDPFPREARRRPTEEDLDKDFDPNEEVEIKP